MISQNRKIVKFSILMGIFFITFSSYFLLKQYEIHKTGEEVNGFVVRIEPVSIYSFSPGRINRRVFKPVIEYTIDNKKSTYIQDIKIGCSKEYTPYCISDFNPIHVGDSVILVVSEKGVTFKGFRGDVVFYSLLFIFGIILLLIRLYFSLIQKIFTKISHFLLKPPSHIDEKYVLFILLFIISAFFFLNQNIIFEILGYFRK